MVVKLESVLPGEQMLRRRLELNLGDAERKVDVSGEVLNLTAQRSLQYFFIVGVIL